jgi:phospholipid/cholesterol/gamma-HCH transport system ATP-binding protein
MKESEATVPGGTPCAKGNAPVIEINHLKKAFGGQNVLKDVSLKLFNNENLVVLGKSGSGKSVLIKCIIRLLEPDAGTIRVLGEDMRDLEGEGLGTLRKKIGFLFQSGALYDSMTVKQNLEFPLRRGVRSMAQKEIDEKVKTALENVGLADALNKMPSQLSGGMRKRVSLARTLVVDPVIMLYDEPTTGLDPATAFEISSLINEVQIKYKTSSIIITHDMACARAVADRIALLQDGEVFLEGDLETFEQSAETSVRAFFGQPSSNIGN